MICFQPVPKVITCKQSRTGLVPRECQYEVAAEIHFDFPFTGDSKVTSSALASPTPPQLLPQPASTSAPKLRSESQLNPKHRSSALQTYARSIPAARSALEACRGMKSPCSVFAGIPGTQTVPCSSCATAWAAAGRHAQAGLRSVTVKVISPDDCSRQTLKVTRSHGWKLSNREHLTLITYHPEGCKSAVEIAWPWAAGSGFHIKLNLKRE